MKYFSIHHKSQLQIIAIYQASGGGGGGGGAAILPAIQGIINVLSTSLPGPGKGPKGGSLVRPGKNGEKIQERFYDENGSPVKDIDWEPGATDHTGRGPGESRNQENVREQRTTNRIRFVWNNYQSWNSRCHDSRNSFGF